MDFSSIVFQLDVFVRFHPFVQSNADYGHNVGWFLCYGHKFEGNLLVLDEPRSDPDNQPATTLDGQTHK